VNARPQVSDRSGVDARRQEGGDSVVRVPDAELDRRVRTTASVWEELVEQLTASGMLPPVGLADQVISFFEVELPRAEAAHTELLRRWLVTEAAPGSRPLGWRRGVDGR